VQSEAERSTKYFSSYIPLQALAAMLSSIVVICPFIAKVRDKPVLIDNPDEANIAGEKTIKSAVTTPLLVPAQAKLKYADRLASSAATSN
jgi:hypothetical protein